MKAFGALDQIYHILGKAYVRSIDTDGFVEDTAGDAEHSPVS